MYSQTYLRVLHPARSAAVGAIGAGAVLVEAGPDVLVVCWQHTRHAGSANAKMDTRHLASLTHAGVAVGGDAAMGTGAGGLGADVAHLGRPGAPLRAADVRVVQPRRVQGVLRVRVVLQVLGLGGVAVDLLVRRREAALQ